MSAERVSAESVAAILRAFEVRLRENRNLLNTINHFPIADDDTGTNLCSTVGSAVGLLAATPGSIEAALRGTWYSASGSSGMIFSLFFSGLADAWAPSFGVDGPALAAGFAIGSQRVTAGFATKFMDGSVVGVMDEVAKQAQGAGGLADVARVAHLTAEKATRRTATQIPVLREAGVVDAGSRAFTYFTAAVEEVMLNAS